MKKIVLLVFVALSFKNAYTQDALGFGLNCIYDDPSFNELIATRNTKVVDVAQNYHIQFLRFPGGTISRSYFWDRQDLIPKTLQLYSNFIETFHRKENFDADKAQQQADYYGNKSEHVESALLGDSLYLDFLKFSKRFNITPIIVMNTWFYHDSKNVYPIVDDDHKSINNAKWDNILANIKAQVQFTHKFVNQVYWEIGNEDYFTWPAETYSNIAAKYVTVIKALYPDDKVILVYSDNPKEKANQANWNEKVINCLAKAKVIDKIDFVAPHYYKDFDNVIKNQGDLINRINGIQLYSKWQTLQSPFNQYPAIKVFYTEFGVFKKIVHPNYNTQTHALFMLFYLMNFNATPNVYGVIQHSFTTKSTGMFFDAKNFKNLNYGFTPSDAVPNNFFVYVPPQAKAVKLFYTYNSAKAQSLKVNNDYAYTVTNTGDKIIINILNYSDHSVNVKINDLATYNANAKMNISKFQFNDLNSKQWDYSANASQSAVTNSVVQLNKNSYSVVTIQK